MSAGQLSKMQANLQAPVEYYLPLGEAKIGLNALLGKPLSLRYEGQIQCLHCGRKTNKSYSQGYCYPCSQRLACCDMCIVKPEQCHFHLGTCREPQWGEDHCLRDHIIYLANASGLKVGITRQTQVPTRWIDQGASQALAVMRVCNRLQSGQVECLLKQHVADKTNWRRMLSGSPDSRDLVQDWHDLKDQAGTAFEGLLHELGAEVDLLDEEPVSIDYPVLEYPDKIRSLNFDKTPHIEGTLLGIKGQYLIFDQGVLNCRKFSGYRIVAEF